MVDSGRAVAVSNREYVAEAQRTAESWGLGNVNLECV